MTQASPAPSVNMALGQLYTNQVLEPALLEALVSTPREHFVPVHLAASAYVDEDLHLGQGRYLMEPLAFARLVQLAEVEAHDKVLDIGVGYGYSTALLARMSDRVVACESIAAMAGQAKQNLTREGIFNVRVKMVAQLAEGAADEAPFNVIFINGGVQRIPESLFAQLAEGGRLVCVQADAPQPGLAHGLGRLTQYKKITGQVFRKESMEAAVPPLPDFAAPAAFNF